MKHETMIHTPQKNQKPCGKKTYIAIKMCAN